MPSIAIQFHALATELADYILAGTTGVPVNFVLLGGLPFSARVIAPVNLQAELITASRAKTPLSLCILPTNPDMSAKSRLQFYDLNPDNILIDIGLQSAAGLMQSRVSNVSCAPIVASLAGAIAKVLRKHSLAGVTAINVESGVKRVNKNLRYTNAAKCLQENGLPMLPFGGGAKLVLGVND